jgi:hypothetical protein
MHVHTLMYAYMCLYAGIYTYMRTGGDNVLMYAYVCLYVYIHVYIHAGRENGARGCAEPCCNEQVHE